MEHATWKKDETAYLVFACSKCEQFIYVKTTQKGKKCLRCGRTHQVKSVLSRGEIVYGVSRAIDRVKELQDTLGKSQFSTEIEFSIAMEKKDRKSVSQAKDEYELLFLDLLKVLSNKYKEFPLYMIELMTQEYCIPLSEVKTLIRKAINKKQLIPSKRKSCYRYKD